MQRGSFSKVIEKPGSTGREALEDDGAEERNRTSDLLITNQLLYRLSYPGIILRIVSAQLAAGPYRRSIKMDYPDNPKHGSGASQRLSSRSIRSFVVRNGRMTDAQTTALDTLLPRWGIPFDTSRLELPVIYGRSAPLWVEIGFGNGDALVHMARLRPETDFLGIEVHAPGVGHALRTIEEHSLTNVRVIQHDAMDVLEHMLAPASAELIALFFPDPWHKKRHHKRRIVQLAFIDRVSRTLAPGGMLHCATDWADYATWMAEHLDRSNTLVNLAGCGCFSAQPEWRASTRFERRGQRLGHEVFDLLYERTLSDRQT